MAVKQVAEAGVVSVQELRVGTVRNVRLNQGLDITLELSGVDLRDVYGLTTSSFDPSKYHFSRKAR